MANPWSYDYSNQYDVPCPMPYSPKKNASQEGYKDQFQQSDGYASRLKF